MPWEKRRPHRCGLKGRENPTRQGALATFQAAPRCHSSTQGVGLRPRPWALFSRPVGPDASGLASLACAGRPCSSDGEDGSRPSANIHR